MPGTLLPPGGFTSWRKFRRFALLRNVSLHKQPLSTDKRPGAGMSSEHEHIWGREGIKLGYSPSPYCSDFLVWGHSVPGPTDRSSCLDKVMGTEVMPRKSTTSEHRNSWGQKDWH